MQPRDVSSSQRRLTKALASALKPALAPFLGLQVTADVIDKIVSAMFPRIVAARRQQVALATKAYRESKRRALPDSKPIKAPPLRDYTKDNLRVAVEDAVKDVETVTEPVVDSLIVAAETHSRNAERNQTIAYTLHDDDVAGWARVDPLPPTCPICVLAISRGPVYKSEKTAGGRNAWHRGDTCRAVPVYQGQEDSYEGIENTRAALDLYKQAAKRPGDVVSNLRALSKGKEPDSQKRSSGTSANARGEGAEKRDADRRAAETQLATLRSLNPKSDTAKAYRDRMIPVLEERIRALS